MPEPDEANRDQGDHDNFAAADDLAQDHGGESEDDETSEQQENRNPRLFISYRRADSSTATGRIYDRLVEFAGAKNVFRDIDSIPLGVPFPQMLSESLSRTDVVIVVIGPSWLSIADESGSRRLDNPDDYVRMEVEQALCLNRYVIPVFVHPAGLPDASELPESIRELSLRNGITLRPDPDFHGDMDRVCRKIQALLGLPSQAIRKSDQVDVQLRDLEQRNQELEAQVQLQERLAEIDRQWQDEREQYKVQYGKNAAAKEPTEGATILATILSIGVMLVYLVIGASHAPGIFTLFFVAIGIGGPIYYWYKLAAFQSAREAMQARRDEATREYAIATDESRSQPKDDAERDPKPKAEPDAKPQDAARLRLVMAMTIGGLVILSCWLAPKLIESAFNDGTTNWKSPTPEQPLISVAERANAPVLVQYLTSDNRKIRDEARQLLQQPELCQSALPPLCKALDETFTGASSGVARKHVLDILSAYGESASNAAPSLVAAFETMQQNQTRYSSQESIRVLGCMDAIGETRQAYHLASAQLLSADTDEQKLRAAQLFRFKPDHPASAPHVQLVLDASAKVLKRAIPDQPTIDVIDWSIAKCEQAKEAPGYVSSLQSELSRLNDTIREELPGWIGDRADLERSAPPRTIRRRVAGRMRSRSNPDWSQHQREVRELSLAIERLSAAADKLARLRATVPE